MAANMPNNRGDETFSEPSPTSGGYRPSGYARPSSGADSLQYRPTAAEEQHEVLRRTIESLSSEQQRELMGIYKDCSREVTVTRALPFAGITVASLYWAKRNLPPHMQLFGNRWPFYVFAGMGAFMAGQLMGFGKCNDRGREYLMRISNQNADNPMPDQIQSEPIATQARELTYDDLREQNREMYRKQRAGNRPSRPVDPPTGPQYSMPREPVPMSGTTGKTSTYGDEGFS